MKRYTTPPLGSNYGATVRMEGPHAPLAVFHPASELERIRNPFLPPEVTSQELVEAEFEDSAGEGDGEGRESDVWSNDASSSRRVPATPTSGRMIAGSFLVFALLGAGAFAALYSAVHSNDRTNRASYDESHVMVAPANANAMPPTPMDQATAPATSSAAPEAVNAATQVDSGALAAHATASATTVPAVAPVRPARVVAAPARAPAPSKYESAPARKAPIVVHVEPEPVPFPRAIEDKDVPVSEDALLAGSAQAARAAPPSPVAPSQVAPAPIASAPSAKADLVPPGNDPADPRQ